MPFDLPFIIGELNRAPQGHYQHHHPSNAVVDVRRVFFAAFIIGGLIQVAGQFVRVMSFDAEKLAKDVGEGVNLLITLRYISLICC